MRAGVGDYVLAAKYLGDQKSTEQNPEELAMQVKALLDLKTSTDLNDLSRLPEGDLKDNLPVNRERVGTVTTHAGPLEIFLVRVDRPNEQSIRPFSQETLRTVPGAYESVELLSPTRDFAQYFRSVDEAHHFLCPLPLWRVALRASLHFALRFGACPNLGVLIFLWLPHRSREESPDAGKWKRWCSACGRQPSG